MKTIPAEIWEWLQEVSFEELDNDSREQVLRVMQAEEYRQLHAVCTQLRTAAQEESQGLYVPEDLKKSLMARFQKQKTNRTPFFLRKIPAWQAVAALILLSTGFIWWKPAANPSTVYLTQTDTLTREIPVYVETKVDCPEAMVRPTTATLKVIRRAGSGKKTLPVQSELQVQPLEILEAPNLKAGSSLAEDERFQQFPTVSL